MSSPGGPRGVVVGVPGHTNLTSVSSQLASTLGKATLEVLDGREYESLTDLATIEQIPVLKLQEIGACGLVNHPVTRLMRTKRIFGIRMAKCVAQERHLAVVQVGSAQEAFGVSNLSDLPSQEHVQIFNSTAYDLQLIEDEVRRVEIVRLGERECLTVFSGSAIQDGRDG